MTERERLRKAIRDLHGCDSSWLRSEPVHETFHGQTVWEGVVEVFALKGHPKAEHAYAWSYETDDGNRAFVAVLGVPPVNTAQDAVRASIAAEAQKARPRIVTRVPPPEFGGPRLHLDARECPICRKRILFLKAWVDEADGPYHLRHGETEHVEARWPWGEGDDQ